MKRRDFLKLIGMCVVAPGTAVAAVKVGSKRMWLSDGKGNCISGEWSNSGVCGDRSKTIIIYDEFDYTTVDFIKKLQRKIHD